MSKSLLVPENRRTRYEQTALPTTDVAALSAVSEALNAPQARLVDSDGNTVTIPSEVHALLVQVVEAMQAGRAIHLTPITTTLTTGEAADFLGISRPTLVKLLENGRIPFSKPNRHRYVLLTDLLEYQKESKRTTRAILDTLSEEAANEKLHEVSMDAIRAALQTVRRG